MQMKNFKLFVSISMANKRQSNEACYVSLAAQCEAAV